MSYTSAQAMEVGYFCSIMEEEGVTKLMPKSLIMSDCCLASLAKSGGIFKFEDLLEFLDPWHSIDKHANKIFKCLEMNRPPLDIDAKPLLQSPSKAERKNVLQTLQTSKKLKNMDNLVIAENVRMTGL